MRLLGAFDALLTERNVTRAAARLNLSQPAASAALAQLCEVRPIAEPFAAVYPIQVLALPPQLVLPAVPVRAIWHERTQHDSACAWLRAVVRECAASDT